MSAVAVSHSVWSRLPLQRTVVVVIVVLVMLVAVVLEIVVAVHEVFVWLVLVCVTEVRVSVAVLAVDDEAVSDVLLTVAVVVDIVMVVQDPQRRGHWDFTISPDIKFVHAETLNSSHPLGSFARPLHDSVVVVLVLLVLVVDVAVVCVAVVDVDDVVLHALHSTGHCVRSKWPVMML
jgi:hypothetical protein